MHEREERRWAKTNFSCLVFSILRKASRIYGVDFRVEEQKDLVCKLFVFRWFGFHGAVPIPYVQAAIFNLHASSLFTVYCHASWLEWPSSKQQGFNFFHFFYLEENWLTQFKKCKKLEQLTKKILEGLIVHKTTAQFRKKNWYKLSIFPAMWPGHSLIEESLHHYKNWSEHARGGHLSGYPVGAPDCSLHLAKKEDNSSLLETADRVGQPTRGTAKAGAQTAAEGMCAWISHPLAMVHP